MEKPSWGLGAGSTLLSAVVALAFLFMALVPRGEAKDVIEFPLDNPELGLTFNFSVESFVDMNGACHVFLSPRNSMIADGADVLTIDFIVQNGDGIGLWLQGVEKTIRCENGRVREE